MIWRKAHRNRKRVEARERTFPFVFPVFPFHVLTTPAFYEVARFHEMLNQLINEHSIAARVLRRKPESLATWRTQLPMPRFPPFRGTKFNIEAVRKLTRSRFIMIVDDIDDAPLNRRGSRMFWGETFMVKIPDPHGLRDDSRRKAMTDLVEEKQ